jgi:nucleotide-binding universal stress UspA family protein
MYHKVLVPLDGSPLSETALDHLRHVAGADTEVILLRVMDVAERPSPVSASAEITPVPPVAPSPQAQAVVDEAVSKHFVDAEEYLEARASHLHGHSRVVRPLVVGDTDPAAAIAGLAEQEQVGLILMSTHGRSGVVRWVLGSVAERVLRATHRPLLLIRPSRPLA